MALQQLITYLTSCGLPSDVTTPEGKWHHSQEYFRLRVHGVRGLASLLRERIAQGDKRAEIQLQLVLSKASEVAAFNDEPEMEAEGG